MTTTLISHHKRKVVVGEDKVCAVLFKANFPQALIQVFTGSYGLKMKRIVTGDTLFQALKRH